MIKENGLPVVALVVYMINIIRRERHTAISQTETETVRPFRF